MMAARMDNTAGKITRYVFAFLLGWVTCGAYYGTLHLEQAKTTLQVEQTKVVPALAAEAGCERWRAEMAKKLALQPTVVDPTQIPKDCPHTDGFRRD